MAILDAFTPGDTRFETRPAGPDQQSSLTLTEICRRADLPLSTGHRLLGELAAGGFLERLPDGAYRIGLRLWRIGAQSSAATGLRELALPHLEDLYEATHDNVQLAVRRGGTALYLERLRGPRSVPILSRAGAELPLHATGVGKVLLAFAPAEVVDRTIAAGLRAYTPHTITDPERLRELLKEVRGRGHVVTREEMTLGSCSVAAPVCDAGGRVVAAISVVTHSQSPDLRRLVPAVLAVARALSRDVAAHWRPTDRDFR